MIVERRNDEILIRLLASMDTLDLQSFLDYLKYKELTATSKATQRQVDELAESVSSSIWKRFKEKRGLL